MEPLRGSVGVVARVLEELGSSDRSRCFVNEVSSSKIRKSIRNPASGRSTIAPIAASCFDGMVPDDGADVMWGDARFDRSSDERVPLPVPNNVADRRVTNNFGYFRTVAGPPSRDELRADVTPPCWSSSGRHPRNNRVFAGRVGESVSVTQAIKSVKPTTHPCGHRITQADMADAL